MLVSPLVVWRFSDGKAGHDNQSRGLSEALNRLRPVQVVEMQLLSTPSAWAAWLPGFSGWPKAPQPDLLVGAGHRTHFSLLAARWSRGGKIVVLMQPSLPLSWFDLCLIPEHDAPPPRRNVLVTRGALNRLQPSYALEPERGLLLIGGPSAHFGWDEAKLYEQIAAILLATPQIRWTLTTSRRTPSTFLAGMPDRFDPPLTVIPVAQTGPDWLPGQLARAGQAWVTADSVSMVYEALTVGARVGILATPLKQENRIHRGIERLAAQGWLTLFARWRQTHCLSRPSGVFAEADRCARWIIEQWFA